MAETLKEKTAKGLFWGAMNNGAMQVIGLVFGIILGRLLSKEDYGMMAMINVFPLIAIALQNSGFASAIGNLKHPTSNDYNSVFWFNIIVGGSLYVILFLCAPFIADFYHDDRLIALFIAPQSHDSLFQSGYGSGCIPLQEHDGEAAGEGEYHGGAAVE